MTNMSEQELWFSDILHSDFISADTSGYSHWRANSSASVP